MIDRYLLPEFEGLFSDESRFNTYLEVEEASLEAWSEIGVIPKEDVALIEKKAKVDVNRISELEAITKHDVVAFTRQISECLGEEKRWVHYGLTSTDVVDTSLSVLYKRANDILLVKLNSLIEEVKEKALEYKDTPCIGRTHGMQGEPISFGEKWALYYDELNRGKKEFLEHRKYVEAAKMSGAMGNYANVDPRVQDIVAKKLGLESAAISSQVLSRDRHEYYSATLAIIASTLEKIAVEIRNLSRSEILEVAEGFSKGQKGSSAMPQKRNPISSENITGGVRMIRGYLLPILEDNALYHERDISHSSVERVALIDQIELFGYAVARMAKVVANLIVYPENMKRNIGLSHGAIFAQRVLTSLVDKGMSREHAYDLVQPYAIAASLGGEDFETALWKIEEISSLYSKEEFDSLFDLSYYLRYTDLIYERVGLK